MVRGPTTDEHGTMSDLNEKFARLGIESAPGQERRQRTDEVDLSGPVLEGTPVDFSHGDVDAFTPIPGSFDAVEAGFEEGGAQAYTEYRGRLSLREDLAAKLAHFTGAGIAADHELIVTPGTQGALFLAMGSCIARGDRVAVVEPDYFANRKLVEFFDGDLVPIPMDFLGTSTASGLDMGALEDAFRSGVRLFIYSNPNNPTGVVYTRSEVEQIGTLAERYGATVIVDELYSRQIFDGRPYTHLRGLGVIDPERVITIMGPSKTESLSGFRLGVAVGPPRLVERMEKLQAIVSLRAAGYSQAALRTWFAEPDGWLAERVAQHQAIRDDIVAVLDAVGDIRTRPTEGGSYLFPTLPPLRLGIADFCKALRLQAAVSVTPGTEFGPAFTRSFRINFSQDHAAAVAAIERTIEVVDRYRAPVLEVAAGD